MSSLFEKLKQEKTRKKKQDQEVYSKTLELQPTVDSPAVSEEELNNLLKTLNEAPVEAGEKLVVTVRKENTEVEAEPERKYFQAIGMYYDSEKRKFIKISIDYDPKTCYTKFNNAEEFADSGATAIFKVNQIFALKAVKGEEVL